MGANSANRVNNKEPFGVDISVSLLYILPNQKPAADAVDNFRPPICSIKSELTQK
jgi:hypothetical protein